MSVFRISTRKAGRTDMICSEPSAFFIQATRSCLSARRVMVIHHRTIKGDTYIMVNDAVYEVHVGIGFVDEACG